MKKVTSPLGVTYVRGSAYLERDAGMKVLKRIYECPLCKQKWTEGGYHRKRGSCPGCGAGWEEMGRRAMLDFAKLKGEGQ